MKTGDLGCTTAILLLGVVLTVFGTFGCKNTEWSVVHEGVLSRADVGGGSGSYINVAFEDGWCSPIDLSYFDAKEMLAGWTLGEEYSLQTRVEESFTKYRLIPVSHGVEEE